MHAADKTLLWIARIGVFLMPFIPLIVSGTMFFPFITGKNFAFRIIALIVFARHGRGKPIPFGPYLAAAGLIALFWGEHITRRWLPILG